MPRLGKPGASVRAVAAQPRTAGAQRIPVFSDVSMAYLSALTGKTVWARTAGGARLRLPMRRWLGCTDAAHRGDAALIGLCDGPTLDIGCGPGRLVAGLLGRGVPALGIDTDAAAIALSRSRGAPVLACDVFADVPGARRWQRVLLADGNIGIGGDPVRLLRRVRDLLAPEGVAVVELSCPGVGLQIHRARLESAGWAGGWFPWALVGVDVAATTASRAGLRLLEVTSVDGRHIALLGRDAVGDHPK